MNQNFSFIVMSIAVLCGIVLLGAALAAIRWMFIRRFGRHGFKKKRLLTPNELQFYSLLKATAGPSWTILAQVSMGALIDTTLKPTHWQYWKARAAFAAKICDYVVCDTKTMTPQLVIELDDVMHDFKKDRLRDEIVATAGFRTLRFWSRKKPNAAELSKILAKELALNDAGMS
jgi:hypothetical protein